MKHLRRPLPVSTLHGWAALLPAVLLDAVLAAVFYRSPVVLIAPVVGFALWAALIGPRAWRERMS